LIFLAADGCSCADADERHAIELQRMQRYASDCTDDAMMPPFQMLRQAEFRLRLIDLIAIDKIFRYLCAIRCDAVFCC
jgi:hypothetical protein